jgi:nitroreductase
MKPIDRTQLLDQLNWRYATKQYDPQRKISPSDLAALEEALVLSPSAFGLQPWTFLVVDDPALRAKLMLASFGQPQIADASHLVVFATKLNIDESYVNAFIRRTAEVRGTTPEALAGLRGVMLRSVVQGMTESERRVWSANQAYIALGNLITSAALLGIDATPMEGIEKARYDDLLGLKQRGLATTVVVALGYRAAADKYATLPKVRFAREQVLQHV